MLLSMISNFFHGKEIRKFQVQTSRQRNEHGNMTAGSFTLFVQSLIAYKWMDGRNEASKICRDFLCGLSLSAMPNGVNWLSWTKSVVRGSTKMTFHHLKSFTRTFINSSGSEAAVMSGSRICNTPKSSFP